MMKNWNNPAVFVKKISRDKVDFSEKDDCIHFEDFLRMAATSINPQHQACGMTRSGRQFD